MNQPKKLTAKLHYLFEFAIFDNLHCTQFWVQRSPGRQAQHSSSSSLVFPADLRHNFSRPSQYVNVVWATPKQMKTLERLGCSSSHWSHSVSKWALLYVRSLVILPKEEYHLKVTLNIWPPAAYSFIRYSPPPSLILQPAVLPSAGSVAKFHKSVGYLSVI